jgi:mediator of RNA polymerase II transcription subunit 10
MLGKERAFAGFRDTLAREMMVALPELKGDVEIVLEATGGKVEGGDAGQAEVKKEG